MGNRGTGGGRGAGRVFLRIGDFERDEESLFLWSILRSFGTIICPNGVKWSCSSFLTSIRGKDSLLYARGGVDAKLFRKECREERKSKFLSPIIIKD